MLFNKLQIMAINVALGRDVTHLIEAFQDSLRNGADACTVEQQIFLTKHYRDLPAFLKTDSGRQAMVNLVVAFQKEKGLQQESLNGGTAT